MICHPMKAQYISTPSRARKIILVVWTAALGLSCAPVAFTNAVRLANPRR